MGGDQDEGIGQEMRSKCFLAKLLGRMVEKMGQSLTFEERFVTLSFSCLQGRRLSTLWQSGKRGEPALIRIDLGYQNQPADK